MVKMKITMMKIFDDGELNDEEQLIVNNAVENFKHDFRAKLIRDRNKSKKGAAV